MASKRPKIYKRDNANSSNETGEMDRKDVEEKIAVVRSRHVRREAENTSRHHTRKHTDYLRIRKAAPVCLVLLCVAMLTAVIAMAVDLYTMIEEFYIKNKNHTDEIASLKKTKEELENSNKKLSQNNNDLKDENPKIQKKVEELWKQIGKMDGWRCNQSSLYFISSEKKNWNESRIDCKERGADLIIIESKEEQEFIRESGGSDSVWIGLTDKKVEGTWEWVNGTILSPGFWGAGEPSGTSTNDEDCAVNLSSGSFGDYSCENIFKWVCERQN